MQLSSKFLGSQKTVGCSDFYETSQNLKHIVEEFCCVLFCLDGTREQTLLTEDTTMSGTPYTPSYHLPAVNSLSHKFNIEAVTTPSTKVS